MAILTVNFAIIKYFSYNDIIPSKLKFVRNDNYTKQIQLGYKSSRMWI